jgi:hypothetical protein
VALGKCKSGHPVDDTNVCWQCKHEEQAQREADVKLAERIRRVIDSGALDRAIAGVVARAGREASA